MRMIFCSASFSWKMSLKVLLEEPLGHTNCHSGICDLPQKKIGVNF